MKSCLQAPKLMYRLNLKKKKPGSGFKLGRKSIELPFNFDPQIIINRKDPSSKIAYDSH